MPRIDKTKTIIRKAPIVMNSAKIVNDKYKKELSYEQAIEEMIRFANSGNFKSYWLDIDNYLSHNYKDENWFWLIRKLSNTIDNW